MRRAHGHSIARSAFGTFSGAFSALLALLPACDGCHGGKPYTPYTLADTPSAAVSAGVVSSPVPDGGAGDAGPAFAAVASAPAPGDGTKWPLEGGVAEPPTGHVFVQGLVLDADGDGKPDLLAWSRGSDGLRGELWFAPGSDPGSGRIVAAFPADVAAPGCSAGATLTQISPRTAVFDFDPRCPARVRDRAARWIAVVRLTAATPEIGLELRLGAPADGEWLTVAADGRDRDGDGRGDVTLTVTLSGAARPLPVDGSAAVALAFLDRPAGLSRDPTEPEASFKALGAALVADGRKKTTSPRIPAAALAARRLHALLCEDGGKPVITTTAGATRCGDVRLIEESTIAEVEAALNLGEPVAAFSALSRLDGLGPHRKDVDALVARSVPSIAGNRIRTTSALPYVQAAPTWGPVAFNAAGDVLVRTRDRVVRVDRASFEEAPVDPAPVWPGRVLWPAGAAPTWTLAAVEERCDAPTLVGRFELGGETTDVPLPVATSPRCAAGARVPIDVLGTSAQGTLFAVRGEVVALPAQSQPRPVRADAFAVAPGAPAEPGAARSPDGGVIALPTSRGVLVAVLKGQGRGATAKLWTAPAGDAASSCAPANGGERLACVVEKGVAIYDAR